MSLTAETDFFVTVDEETGEGISHGSGRKRVELSAGEYAKVGDIAGWEWDSSLHFDITVEVEGRSLRLGYNLKSSTRIAITLPGMEKGTIVRIGYPPRLVES